MHILLLIFYSLVCGYGIIKIPFIRKSGIRPVWLLLFFAAHTGAGWIHNAIAYRYFPGHGDIWDYFWKSFLYRHRLFSQFDLFLADNSTWTYVSHNGIIFIQMLLDVFSFDHMDINTLLFAFPVFLGSIALFRVFQNRFPDDKLTGFSIFLLPSVLFWTSCIYREGVLFMLLGFLIYTLDRLLTRRPEDDARPHQSRQIIYALLCFAFIAYFRIATALTLIPAVFTWWLMEKPAARRPLLLTAATTLGIAIILLLTIPGLSLPLMLAHWQQEFYMLKGNSRLWLPALDGSWHSLFRTLPVAELNGLLEPLPGAGGQPIYLAFSLELLAIWLIIALSLVRRFTNPPPDRPSATTPDRLSGARPVSPRNAWPPASPFGVFCVVFALLGMLSIGLIVPFAGTIVRYRSIFLPFLLAPFLHSLRSQFPRLFQIKNNHYSKKD